MLSPKLEGGILRMLESIESRLHISVLAQKLVIGLAQVPFLSGLFFFFLFNFIFLSLAIL